MIQNPEATILGGGYSNTPASHVTDGDANLGRDANLDSVDRFNQQQSKPLRYRELIDVLGCQLEQIDNQEASKVCRVCQCADPDRDGEEALKALGISFPSQPIGKGQDKIPADVTDGNKTNNTMLECKTDLEAGKIGDSLIQLGCACKSDIGLAHYACALRWFLSRGSIICEICGTCASNIRSTDREKVFNILKERHSPHNTINEAVSWFDPHGNIASEISRNSYDLVTTTPEPGVLESASPAAKWAVEGTGILIATGLLTVTITWLISLRVDKGVATKGLNILLSGLCALVIVIFLRFGVLPRIKYGPARYWAILVVFWFLIFGVWASTTRNSHTKNN